MKIFYIFSSIFLIVSSSLPCAASESVEVSGYFLSDLSYRDYKNETIHKDTVYNFDKFLLKSTFYLKDNLEVRLQYQALAYFGEQAKEENEPAEQFFLNRPQVDIHKVVKKNKKEWIEHSLERAYISYFTDKVNIFIGKQRIQWGVGRIWNPTDIFNPISPTDRYSLERQGVDAAIFEYNPNFVSKLQLGYAIERKPYDDIFLALYKTNFKDFDWIINAAVQDKAVSVGGGFDGSLAKFGVRGELMWTSPRIKSLKNYLQFILGGDYAPGPSTIILAEYLYTDLKTGEALYGNGVLPNGVLFALGRHNAALNVTHTLSPLLSLSMTGITDVENISQHYIIGQATYSYKENIDLRAGLEKIYVDTTRNAVIGFLQYQYHF